MFDNIIRATPAKAILFLILGSLPATVPSQAQKIITLNEAVNTVLANHPIAKNAELRVQSTKASIAAFPYLRPAEFKFVYGQMYSSLYNKSFEINQNLGSPFTIYHNLKLGKEQILLSETDRAISLKQLTAMVKSAYMKWLFDDIMVRQTQYEAELYGDFETYYPQTTNVPDSLLPEKTAAQSLYADVHRRLFVNEEEFHYSTNQMQQLLLLNETPVLADTTLELYAVNAFNPGEDKFYPWTHIAHYEQMQKVKEYEARLERSKLTPEIKGGYFNHEIEKLPGFKGYIIGLTFPLFFPTQLTKIKEAKINQQIAFNELEYQKLNLRGIIENLQIRLDQYFVSISYYRENALNEAEVLIRSSINQFTNKKIGYRLYLENIAKAFTIKTSYFETLRLYNETAIELEHYLN